MSTRKPTPTGKTFQVGHDPRRSVRSTGRPPDEWKRALAQLVTRDETLAHMRAVLDAGADHPQFFRALAYATDHGIGRAVQPVDVTSDGRPITVISGIREPLAPMFAHVERQELTV